MKSVSYLNKSVDTVLSENDALCRQLAKLQQRASELIQKRSAELDQLGTVVEFLTSELHDREATIAFLRVKLAEFHKGSEQKPSLAYFNQFNCK